MPSPPAVDESALDGWRRVDSSVDRPFDIRILAVTAYTDVYDDPELAAALAERANADASGPGRFFLVSRVELRPAPPSSRALRRLVTERVADDFAAQLRQRGFTSVRRVEDRGFDVRGRDARLVSYEGVCPLDSVALDVRGWLAVWNAGDDFVLAGGAYPTTVRGASGETDDSHAAVAELLDPNRFRTELFELIRAVETA